MVFVLLPTGDIGVGETVVEPHPASARDMRQDAVEDFASSGIGIEPAIDKIAQTAPGLRAAPGIRLIDRPALLAERVRATSAIFLAIAQKADEIAHRGMAEPQHQRVASGIDELVDPTRLEPSGNVYVAIGGDHRLHGALVVETGTTFDPGKAPVFRRHRYPLVIGIAPPRQPRLARVQRDCRMAADRGAATQRECRPAGPVGDVFSADEPGQRPAAFARDGQVEQQPPIPRQQVALPGEPNDCVAAAHQETIAGMRQAARVVGSGRIIEELQHPLVAAVAVIEKQTAVAAHRIDRLQDRKIAGEMDEAAVGRCFVEIGNAVLSWGGKLDREMRASDEPFISSDWTEFMAIGKHKALGDRQLHSIGHQTRLQKSKSTRSIVRPKLTPLILRPTMFNCSAFPGAADVAQLSRDARAREIRTNQLQFMDSASEKQERAGQIRRIDNDFHERRSDGEVLEIWPLYVRGTFCVKIAAKPWWVCLPDKPQGAPAATSRMASANAWARGTMVSMRHHSSSAWALPPTGPVPHRVGVPSAAVKPLSAEPPVASPETRNPRPAADRS